MKYSFFIFASVLLVPFVVFADAGQVAAQHAHGFVRTFNEVILFPTIALLMAVAFLVFLWGCAQYFLNATSDQARQQGIKHITWGIIGLVIMVSTWAILEIAAATFGLSDELDCANNPSASDDCAGVFTLPGGTSQPSAPAQPDTTQPTQPAQPGTTQPSGPAEPGTSQPVFPGPDDGLRGR